MHFSASFDGLTKLITALILLVVPLALLLLLRELSRQEVHGAGLYVTLGAAGLAVLALLLAYLLHPSAYFIGQRILVVRRPLFNVSVPLSAIAEVRQLTPEEEKAMAWRLFGVGGFFGYFGKYWHPTLGRMTWYATQRRNRVLVTTRNGKKLLFTPDDLAFEKAIQADLLNEVLKQQL